MRRSTGGKLVLLGFKDVEATSALRPSDYEQCLVYMNPRLEVQIVRQARYLFERLLGLYQQFKAACDRGIRTRADVRHYCQCKRRVRTFVGVKCTGDRAAGAGESNSGDRERATGH